MDTDVSVYLIFLSISGLISLALFRYLTIEWKLLSVIIWLTISVELISHLPSRQHEVYSIAYNLYTPITFGLYIWIYHSLFQSRSLKLVTSLMFLLAVAAGLFAPILTNSFQKFPSLSIAFCSLLVCSCSLLYYFQMLQSRVKESLSSLPTFWFNTAVLLYWGVFFYRHGLYQTIVSESPGSTIWLDDLHLWLSLIYYAVLAYVVVLGSGRFSPSNKIHV